MRERVVEGDSSEHSRMSVGARGFLPPPLLLPCGCLLCKRCVEPVPSAPDLSGPPCTPSALWVLQFSFVGSWWFFFIGLGLSEVDRLKRVVIRPLVEC